MALADVFLTRLQGRVSTLTTRRAELLQKRTEELAKLDSQVQACRDLALGWQTLPVKDALALVEAAGIGLRLEE